MPLLKRTSSLDAIKNSATFAKYSKEELPKVKLSLEDFNLQFQKNDWVLKWKAKIETFEVIEKENKHLLERKEYLKDYYNVLIEKLAEMNYIRQSNQKTINNLKYQLKDKKRDFVAEGFFARHEGHHEPNYGIAAVNSDKKPDERGSRYDSGEYYGYRQDKNSPSSSSRSGYTKNVKLQQAKDRYGFGNLLDGYGAPDYSYAYGYSFGEPYGYEEYTLDPRILKGKRSAYLWWDDDYKIREKEYIPVEYRPEYGLSDYEAFDNYYHDYDTNYDLDYDYDDPGYYQDYDYEDPADYEESDLEYDDYDESDSEYSDDYDESDYDSYNDEYDDDDVDYDADQDIAYDEYIPADYDYGSGWVEVTNGGEELNEGYEPIGDEYASYSDEYRDQDQNGWPFRKKFSRKPY